MLKEELFKSFKSFTCIECGGEVKLLAIKGRIRIIEVGVESIIPEDFELPTCLDCGEYYISVEYSEELDEILKQMLL